MKYYITCKIKNILSIEHYWFFPLSLQLREYSLTETYHEDDVEMEFVSSENQVSNGYGMQAAPTPRAIDPNQDLNEAIAEERREMDTQRYR